MAGHLRGGGGRGRALPRPRREVPLILLDADVLIDIALDREPWSDASAALVAALEARPRMAFVAWHTLSNLYYLVRPARGAGGVREFILDLTTFVTVAPASTDGIRYAAALPLGDFEDAMQVAAARECGARVIATRNVQDFRASPIPARTPVELVEELGL